jgi:hypothetical protein
MGLVDSTPWRYAGEHFPGAQARLLDLIFAILPDQIIDHGPNEIKSHPH